MKILLTGDLHYGFNENTHLVIKKFLKGIMGKETFDVMIITGDLASHDLKHMEGICKLLRSYMGPELPIAVVLGNHDLWHKPHILVEDIIKQHMKTFAKYKITYLPNEPIELNGHKIYGFDGWYANRMPPSNDHHWIQPWKESWEHLRRRNDIQLTKVLDDIAKPSAIVSNIVVTHFDFWGEMANSGTVLVMLEGKVEGIMHGHTHMPIPGAKRGMSRGMLLYNAGSDYNDPKYVIIDIPLKRGYPDEDI